ncbi:hypothetical protein [Dyella sp.]|jgi:hypothetical protein|uniref:hypothetical protein n=1 Tax=Dyella sp. TaxID=1869338 RepID=UPI002D78FF0F|nr:hypothetical protein [Dyella sp.]HET6431020.1 hypothetical protein [Dyella sp.]
MSEKEQEATSFVIEQRDKIEIYAGEHGHVVIKQDSYTGEESVVLIHPDDVELVIRHILAARDEAYEIRATSKT